MKDGNYEIIELQNNLAMLRKLFGWTAEQMGNRLGVTKQTILNLERGNPKMSTIQYVAIRTILETEANAREGEERENLLKVLKLVFYEEESITEEQREKALETTNVVATATAGRAASMNVLTGALSALGITTACAVSPVMGTAMATGVIGWVATMLNKMSSEEQGKKEKIKK